MPDNPSNPQQPGKPALPQLKHREAEYFSRPGGMIDTEKYWYPAQQPKGYQPTFWEQPKNIVKYYNAIKAAPPGWQAPPWLDPVKIEKAYNYLKINNPNYPNYLWEYPNVDDPIRQELQSWQLPDPSTVDDVDLKYYMPEAQQQPIPPYNPEAIQAYTNVQQAIYNKQVKTQEEFNASLSGAGSEAEQFKQMQAWFRTQTPDVQQEVAYRMGMPVEDILNMNLDYQPQEGAEVELVHGIPKETWDQLPQEQRNLIQFMPAIQTAVQVGGGALAGMSMMGGPWGLIPGAVGGYLLEKGVIQGIDPVTGEFKDNWAGGLAQAMMKLDIPAEYAERGLGVLSQVIDSAVNPKEYGSLGELLSNLNAAWDAAHMSWEAFGTDLGYDRTIRGMNLGDPNDVITKIPETVNSSSWALAQMRKEIAAGNKTTDEIYQEWGRRFGFYGTLRDMVGHMLLDPLNAVGESVNAVGAFTTTAVTDNATLARAFMRTRSPLEALQMYANQVRQLPTPEAAQFGKLTKLLAGLDEAGMDIRYAKDGTRLDVGPARKFLDYVTKLTPQSKANMTVMGVVDQLHQMANDLAPDNPHAFYDLLKELAGYHPGDTINTLLGNDKIPRWINSAEAQHIPQFARDMLPNLERFLGDFDISRGNANVITQVAELLQVNPRKLIADLMDTGADPDTVWRNRMDDLARRAAGYTDNKGRVVPPDATAARNLQLLQEGGMTGRQIKSLARGFFGENKLPFDGSEAIYHMLNLVEDAAGKWAADWFGVKPEHWVFRMSNMIKHGQSLALLGLNPSYAFNNILNNVFTMIWDGTLGFHGHARRMQFLKDMEMTPTRLWEGMGAAELGHNMDASLIAQANLLGIDPGDLTKAIRAATKKGGLIQDLDNFFHGGDKFAVFSKLSNKMERWSSEMAMTTAMMDYWNKIWRDGVGFDKMDGATRQILDAVQPGLAKKVEKAIARGKNKAQIEREVFSNLTRKSLRDVLSADEASLLDGFIPGLVDRIDDGVRNATDDIAVRKIFTDVRKEIVEDIRQRIVQNIAAMTQRAAQDAALGRTQGVLDIANQIIQKRYDFWMNHMMRMDEIARQASELTGPARRMLWDRALAEADEEWRSFNDLEGARWLGMYQGLGADAASPAYQSLMARLTDLHTVWSNFYHERSRLMNDFFDSVESIDDKAERQALWERTNKEISDNYNLAVVEENEMQLDLDVEFAEMYARQFADTNPTAMADAMRWRDQVRLGRQRMVEAQVMYREGELPAELLSSWGNVLKPEEVLAIKAMNNGQPISKLSVAARERAARKFSGEIYTVLLREMFERGRNNLPENAVAAAAAEAPTNPAAAAQPAVGQPAVEPVRTTPLDQVHLAAIEQTGMPELNTNQPLVYAEWLNYLPNGTADDFRAYLRAWRENRADIRQQRNAANLAAAEVGREEPLPQRYLLNIVKRYGENIPPDLDLDGLRSLSPEVIRRALANWRRAHENDTERLNQVAVDRRINQERAAGMAALAKQLEEAAPVRTARQAFASEVYDWFYNEPEKAQGVLQVVEGIARHWARENQVEPDEWYEKFLLEKAGQTEEALNQPEGPVFKHDNPVTKYGNEYQSWLAEHPRAVTGWFENLYMSPADLMKIPGENGEHLKIQADLVNNLQGSIQEKGYDQGSKPLIIVKADGTITVFEGNHRIRAALRAGVNSIPVDLRYEGGSELLDTPWKPSAVSQLASKLGQDDIYVNRNLLAGQDTSSTMFMNDDMVENLVRATRRMGLGEMRKAVLNEQTKGQRYRLLDILHKIDPEMAEKLAVEPGMLNPQKLAQGEISGRWIPYKGIETIGEKVTYETAKKVGGHLEFGEFRNGRMQTEDGYYRIIRPYEGQYDVEVNGEFTKTFHFLWEAIGEAESDARKNRPNMLKQDEPIKMARKGSTYWNETGQAVIELMKTADQSTFVHEMAHVWMPMMSKADLDIVARWIKTEFKQDLPEGWEKGVTQYATVEINNRKYGEKELFARAFEKYLADGIAPTPELQSLFEKFKRWMVDIYTQVTGSQIDIPINQELRGLFDRWTADIPAGTDPAVKRPAALGRDMMHPVEAKPLKPLDRLHQDMLNHEPKQVTGVADLVRQFMEASPQSMAPEKAKALGELVSMRARAAGYDPDDYVTSKIRGVLRTKDNTFSGEFFRQMDIKPNDISFRESVMRYWAKEGPAIFNQDFDDYVEGLTTKLHEYFKGDDKALRMNQKTILALDISADCVWRKMGKPCTYCYVETPRTKELIKGAQGAQAANKVYTAATFEKGSILNMDPNIIRFINDSGGMRVFSIGDFTEEQIPQLIQAFSEARRAGLQMKVITKQQATLDFFLGDGIDILDPATKTYRKKNAEMMMHESGLLQHNQKLDNVQVNLSADFEPSFMKANAETAKQTLIAKAVESLKTTGHTPWDEDFRDRGMTNHLNHVDWTVSKMTKKQAEALVQPAIGDTPATPIYQQIERMVKGMVSEFETDGANREIYGFGWTLKKAQEMKGKYAIRDENGKVIRDRITVRYVAMNKQEAMLAIADDRIDLVTNYHGINDPAQMYAIWESQNPNIAGMKKPGIKAYADMVNLFGKPLNKRKGKTRITNLFDLVRWHENNGNQDVFTPRGRVTATDVDPGETLDQFQTREKLRMDTANEVVRKALKDARIADKDITPDTKLGELGLGIDVLDQFTKILVELNPHLGIIDPEKPNKHVSQLKGSLMKLFAGYDIDYKKYPKGYKGTKELVMSSEDMPLKTYLWAYLRVWNATPMEASYTKLSELIRIMLEGQSFYGRKSDLGPFSTWGLAGIFDKTEPFEFPRQIANDLFEQPFIDTLLADAKLPHKTIEQLAKDAWKKLCCQNARCGTCPVCCAFKERNETELFKRFMDGGELRSAIEWDLNNKAILRAFNDTTTVGDFLYTLGPVFRQDLTGEDMAILYEAFKVTDGVWRPEHEAKFAKQLEGYLWRNDFPVENPKLLPILEKVSTWLRNLIYDLGAYLGLDDNKVYSRNVELRKLFDRMFFENPLPRNQKGELILPDGTVRKVNQKVKETVDQVINEKLNQDANDNMAARSPVGAFEPPEPPLPEAMLEGYQQHISPLLDRMQNALTGKQAMEAQGAFDVNNLPPEAMRVLKSYLGKVNSQMSDAKMGAQKWGETRRDFSLLNYSKRTGMDNLLGTIMPYEFWYTHSMMNWALRALNRPSMLANYARLRTFGDRVLEQEGTPYRLRNKMSIKVPFLPDWMGDYVYLDPLRQAFPFETLLRPLNNIAEDRNQTIKRAEGLLAEMVEDGEITKEEYGEIKSSRSGQVWDKVFAQAENEVDADVKNPMDFAFAISSPSLPVSILSKVLQGEPEDIGQLPITKTIQTVTGALGLGGPRGVNIEGWWRKAAGLPEVDKYEDYRVDRMLSNMAAEGVINTDEALQGMIDRQGEAYEQAQRRVSQMQTMTYFGAPLGVDLFPEGEEQQRALKKEYDRAMTYWKAGDEEALNKFWDKYPEQEARRASFREPEERLRKFLISEVWRRYNELPDLHKKQAQQQLGNLFRTAFISKDTRSYDSINTETMAEWARAIKANVPITAPGQTQLPLDLADEATTREVQFYNDYKEQNFPGLSEAYALADQTGQYPAVTEAYQRWRNQYLADHPRVIPWVTGEDSELYGLDTEIQKAIYKYRATKDSKFPGIYDIQAGYFELENQIDASTTAGKKQLKAAQEAYMQAHPQLDTYWKYRKQTAAENPKAAPYILGEDSLANMIVPGTVTYEDEAAPGSQLPPELVTPALARQLMGWIFNGVPLGSGAKAALEDIWEQMGEPGGDFDAWVEGLQ